MQKNMFKGPKDENHPVVSILFFNGFLTDCPFCSKTKCSCYSFLIVVGNYINIIKTIFDFILILIGLILFSYLKF